MKPKRLLLTLASLAVAALVVVGLLQAKGSPAPTPPSRLTLAQMRASLAGSPPRWPPSTPRRARCSKSGCRRSAPACTLSRGRRSSSTSGRPGAARAARSSASSSGPRSRRAGRSRSSESTPRTPTAPTPSPSCARSRSAIRATTTRAGRSAWRSRTPPSRPVTVFYNRSGGVYIHQGQYPSVEKLEADIRRYALGPERVPELRIDPLSGHRTIVAGERSRRPGGEPALRAADADRSRGRPVRRGPRGPHAAGALRASGRRARRRTRPAGA